MLFPHSQPLALTAHPEKPILDNSLINVHRVLPSQQQVCAKIKPAILIIFSSI